MVIGAAIVFGAGAKGSNAGWGIAVPTGAKALVRDAQGTALIVNVDTGKEDRVIFKEPDTSAANYPSVKNGYELRLSD
jgi:hypothetical protein